MAKKKKSVNGIPVKMLLGIIFLLAALIVVSTQMAKNKKVNLQSKASVEETYQVIKQNVIAKDSHKIFTRACNKKDELPGFTSCDPWFEVTKTMLPIMPSGTYANQIGGYAYYDSSKGAWQYRRFLLESNVKNPKLQNLWWQICPINSTIGPLWSSCTPLTKITDFSNWVKNKGFMNNVVTSYVSYATIGSDGYHRFVHFMMGQSTNETLLYGRACAMGPNVTGEMQDCSQWIRLTAEEASWKLNCPGNPVCAANGRFRSYGIYPYWENGIEYLRKIAVSRDGTKIYGNTCRVPSTVTWSNTTLNWQEGCAGWAEIDLLPDFRDSGVRAIDSFEVYMFGLDNEYHVAPTTQL